MATHFKLSTSFYSLQLADILSYEVPTPRLNTKTELGSCRLSHDVTVPHQTLSITVYNFHSLLNQTRLFLFISDLSSDSSTRPTNLISTEQAVLSSVSELFFSANWLEREVSELHGILFSGKKDLRNLMLQYGDSSSPFQKFFPTIGLKELYYNPVKDTLVQSPVSCQL